MVKNVSDSRKNACNNYEINVYNISIRNQSHNQKLRIQLDTFKDNHEITIYIKTKLQRLEKKGTSRVIWLIGNGAKPKNTKNLKPLKSINNVFNDNQNSTIFY